MSESIKPESELSIREKARRHLMTWSKTDLAWFMSKTVSDRHLERYAEEYDLSKAGKAKKK